MKNNRHRRSSAMVQVLVRGKRGSIIMILRVKMEKKNDSTELRHIERRASQRHEECGYKWTTKLDQKQTFTCPNPPCNGVSFPTARLLIRHKSTSLFHEYCRKCDLDFPSLETKLIHLIESERHRACAECGEEFGCEDGLVRHVWRVSYCIAFLCLA